MCSETEGATMNGDLDIRVRVDADGVLADFASAVQANLGFHPDDDCADLDAMWAFISEDPGFWEGLDELPGARDLWRFVSSYNASVLTGVGGDPLACQRGKKAWMLQHLGCRNTVVTNSWRKREFCRVGDILIDDRPVNITAWADAGGIGILHTDTGSTIEKLKAAGVLGDGVFSDALLAKVRRQKAQVTAPRQGFSAYKLSRASQDALVVAFGVRPGLTGLPYSLVCHHVTRAMPVLDDTVDDAQPPIEVRGEFFSAATGHHVLVVAVGGSVIRPDGGIFHITYGLDKASAAVREAAGGKTPAAGGSNQVLNDALDAAGGDLDVLDNLPPERRVAVQGDWMLMDTQKATKMARKLNPGIPEEVETEAWAFGKGVVEGGVLVTAGQKTTRRKGGIETVIYELVMPDGTLRKHGEGYPAIERRNPQTGESLFTAWATNGTMANAAALNDDEAPAPKPR
jgi:hypothetical protein